MSGRASEWRLSSALLPFGNFIASLFLLTIQES